MSDYLTDDQIFEALDRVLAVPVESDDDLDISDNSDVECNPTFTVSNEQIGYIPEEPNDEFLCDNFISIPSTSSTPPTNNHISDKEPTPSTSQQQQVTRKRGRPSKLLDLGLGLTNINDTNVPSMDL